MLNEYAHRHTHTYARTHTHTYMYMYAYLEMDVSCAFAGDEILSINSKPLHGMTHAEAIAEFKSVKAGDVVLHVGRRVNRKKRESLTLASVNPPAPRQPVK